MSPTLSPVNRPSIHVVRGTHGLPYPTPDAELPLGARGIPKLVLLATFGPGVFGIWAALGALVWIEGFSAGARVTMAVAIIVATWLPALQFSGRRVVKARADLRDVAVALEPDRLRAIERDLVKVARTTALWSARDQLYSILFDVRTSLGEYEPALRVASARAMLHQVQQSPVRFAAAAQQLAYGFAMIGELDFAEQWLQSPAMNGQTPARITDAVLALRAADPPTTLTAWFETEWPRIEIEGDGRHTRYMRVLWAYAAEREKREDWAQIAAAARPSPPGQLARWATSWPEMQAFLVRASL